MTSSVVSRRQRLPVGRGGALVVVVVLDVLLVVVDGAIAVVDVVDAVAEGVDDVAGAVVELVGVKVPVLVATSSVLPRRTAGSAEASLIALSVVPWPSWPYMLLPQQTTPPSSTRMAQK
mmetsp:Transcript_101305/g.291853  ORF Transcript_101305/g.291853 Transcript_101305/m.291853 type:complete len:119 (-) Transcript_101305:1064-1420(-)